MFWGVLHPIRAVLPGMVERRRGRIVNVTSIGGKLAVPHLLPYACAKFAAVGLSEGLRAELARYGIRVTTVVPGLMRTGSHLNATFRGQVRAEYALFALAATLPVLSIDAERAARAIVRAARRGDPEVILGSPANLAVRFHGLFPGLTSDLAGLVGWLLPGPGGRGERPVSGMEVDAGLDSRLLDALTSLGRSAARRFQQHPGPSPAAAGAAARPGEG